MAQKVLVVRRELWNLTESKRIRVDEFEICALALALRLNRQPRFATESDRPGDATAKLAKKLERFRKRAKTACIKKFGRHERQQVANRWRAYVAWTRYYGLTASLSAFGYSWRRKVWRKQREELTEVLEKVLDVNFYEPLPAADMRKIVTLAASTFRRKRRAVVLRELLKTPVEHTQILLEFITARAVLKKRADAPKSLCERQSEIGDKLRTFMERRYASPVRDEPTAPEPQTQHHTSATVEVRRPAAIRHTNSTPPGETTPSKGSPSWQEWLRDFVAQWFLHCVDPVLRRDVCEQAQYLIGNNLLEQFRRSPTTGTTFNSLFAECRPGPEEEPINWCVTWVLTSLLALGRSPSQCYTDVQPGFGEAIRMTRF